MIARRQFLGAMAQWAIGMMGVPGCTDRGGLSTYEQAVRTTWRHGDGNFRDERALQRELVRYATLAASSHNSQCWKFRFKERHISILPDWTRRCPAVDPDDHHLFASLGCATENLVQAARANGLHCTVNFQPRLEEAIEIELEPATAERSALFQAIPERQSTRAEYDGRPLPSAVLRQLEDIAKGNGVNVLLLTEKTAMEQVLEYVVQGNTAQMNDPAFLDELKTWMRFSENEAVNRGDGLFSASSGNPTVPRWLGDLLLRLFYTAQSENEKYARHIRSSAGIAVFVAEINDQAHWVEAGRGYERFALQAAALGVRTAFLNQPVEVQTLRPQFASYLGIGNRRPDLVLRFGHGPQTPRSLRRPVDRVMIESVSSR